MSKRMLMVMLVVLVACSGAGDRIAVQPVDRPSRPAQSTIVASGGTEEGAASETPREAPAAPDDVEFRDYGENTFVRPEDDGLSTFAVDVDTGSYTIMRQWVEAGLVPPPESVRPEEYVNFFDPGYEPPRHDTFAVYADAAPTPWTDHPDDVVLRVGIQGQELAARERPPLAVTLVLDVSGSMQEDNRLELVKDSVAMLVEQLGRGDTVAVVAYDTSAWVVLAPTPGDDHRTIMAAIDGLSPGGSTNAEAGILTGYELADEAFDPEAVNRVVLLSDGVANVGVDGPEGIIEQIDRQVDRGIGLLTVGVGLGNYNDYLMEQLADGADGNYRYIDDLDEAERVLVDDLTGTLVTIAADMKVQVEFNTETVSWYRLIGFENREVADDDFRDDRVDGGEIGSGHSVTALYQLELAPGVRTADRLADVTVRWVDPERGDVDEVTGTVTADVVSARWDDAAPEFRLATTAAAYAEALRGGRYAVGFDLADVADEADRLADEMDNAAVLELADLAHLAARAADGDRR